MLEAAGVQVLIGSDGGGPDLLDEARYLASLDVMSETEIFALLTTLTPRVLFPDRRIGHLRDGWEASFLVLEGDPTRDLGYLGEPSVVVKQGHVRD
jgi:imidazolonepropionase-like amidohydrolase